MKIIPVDLFPQTRGFELVIFFERVGWGDILNTEIAKRIRWRQRDNKERRTLIAIIIAETLRPRIWRIWSPWLTN